MKVSHAIGNFFESHIWQLGTQILTVAGLLLAAYITARLTPILTRLDRLESRVQAEENRSERLDPLVERFIVVEQHDKQNTESIKKIEEKVDRIYDIQIKQYIRTTGELP